MRVIKITLLKIFAHRQIKNWDCNKRLKIKLYAKCKNLKNTKETAQAHDFRAAASGIELIGTVGIGLKVIRFGFSGQPDLKRSKITSFA